MHLRSLKRRAACTVLTLYRIKVELRVVLEKCGLNAPAKGNPVQHTESTPLPLWLSEQVYRKLDDLLPTSESSRAKGPLGIVAQGLLTR